MMTKNEIVRSAIKHKETDQIPYNIHLAGDAFKAYGKRLFDQYAPVSMRKLVEKELTRPIL